jgi:hypothetical protein
MRDNDDILLESLYSTIISETRNTQFLKELDPLLKKWRDIQSSIKGTIPTFQHDHEGNPYDAPDAGQQIDKKDLPVYFQNTKIDKSKTTHPNLRRAYHAQTYDEVQLEKELLRIYQKYADQEYFNKDVVFIHDFGYNAAAYNHGIDGAPDRNETIISYLENENKIHKDVLSCHGVDATRYNLNNTGNYGLIVKGRVLYASRGDLASQTFRTIPKAAREFFKHSGVPKRTSVEKVHSTEEDNSSLSMRKRLAQRKGEEMSREDINDFLNNTILDKNDSPIIEEALLGNWRIQGWFFCRFDKNGLPSPSNFWKKAYESNIQKPVYFIELNTQNKPEPIDLKKYYQS